MKVAGFQGDTPNRNTFSPCTASADRPSATPIPTPRAHSQVREE
jgi:hypothetical protein